MRGNDFFALTETPTSETPKYRSNEGAEALAEEIRMGEQSFRAVDKTGEAVAAEGGIEAESFGGF